MHVCGSFGDPDQDAEPIVRGQLEEERREVHDVHGEPMVRVDAKVFGFG